MSFGYFGVVVWKALVDDTKCKELGVFYSVQESQAKPVRVREGSGPGPPEVNQAYCKQQHSQGEKAYVDVRNIFICRFYMCSENLLQWFICDTTTLACVLSMCNTHQNFNEYQDKYTDYIELLPSYIIIQILPTFCRYHASDQFRFGY